jgi:transposase
MIGWAEVPVYLHRAPVDFRKSINGLAQVVEQGMGRSPMERALFVFGAKSRDKIKVLYWDRTGFCLWTKRLEKDRFQWPRTAGEEVMTLSAEQFDWLLRGFDILRMKPHVARSFDVM